MDKSKIIWIVVIGMIVIGIFSSVGKYNSFIGMEEDVDAQWAQVENQYQRRYDLIPNLVNTVKGYADFEKETLLGVTQARAAALGAMQNASGGKNLQALQEADKTVGVAMGRFFGYTERYPDLKANQGFLNLQAQLEGTENRVSTERMRFNEMVKGFNKGIKRFPGNIFASMFGFEEHEFFESSIGSEVPPTVSFD